jgi:SAM-dependent methyltransferase/DNA-binding CsgD family transcriptional regulator
MISPHFLKDISDKHSVTDAELEVLVLAVGSDGDSTTEIAQQLGVTPDAVRKRLGEVYQKFGVPGSGPGKLVKLRQMLEEEYQKHRAMKKVFIAWSGEDGKCLAEGLKETILAHRKVEPWLANWDMTSEKPWLLGDADFGVACLTSSSSTLLNFQVGFLFGHLRHVRLLRLDEPLGGPLENVAQVNGTSKDDLTKLLSEILDGELTKAEEWVDEKFLKWKEFLDKAADKSSSPNQARLDSVIDLVEQSTFALRESEIIRTNECYQKLVIQSLTGIRQWIECAPFYHAAPASLYPFYLLTLQQEFKARVTALALVGQEEHFWQEETGREIAQSSHAESRRIFVFMKPEDFERSFEVLLEHAARYKVRTMSYEILASGFPGYVKDISILAVSDDHVLALYEGIGTEKKVRFSVGEEVLNYEKVLDQIWEDAVEISSKVTELNPAEILEKMRQCRHLTFGRPMPRSALRSIEMSEYIDVEDYDQHEEKHAYFQEMVETMLRVFSEDRGSTAKQCRVLEMGSGTGLFTQRLAKLKNISIVALELDWVCIKKLQHKLGNNACVEIFNEDACTYDPSGRFRYVFSSFADHHIKLDDKELYFQNIKRNLEPGGLLIVGDEFLPDYDINDDAAWRSALRSYHNHIIGIAEEQGEDILARLERDALQSGLERKGDFKLSCKQYEEYLLREGFSFKKKKIGPKDRDDMGGIYVYTAWLPK